MQGQCENPVRPGSLAKPHDSPNASGSQRSSSRRATPAGLRIRVQRNRCGAGSPSTIKASTPSGRRGKPSSPKTLSGCPNIRDHCRRGHNRHGIRGCGRPTAARIDRPGCNAFRRSRRIERSRRWWPPHSQRRATVQRLRAAADPGCPRTRADRRAGGQSTPSRLRHRPVHRVRRHVASPTTPCRSRSLSRCPPGPRSLPVDFTTPSWSNPAASSRRPPRPWQPGPRLGIRSRARRGATVPTEDGT